MEPDANRVLEKARRGDSTATSDLIELFYARIYAFLRRLSGNETDAADLTQRTFSRVWQSLQTFANRSTVSSWIHGIAYHVYVDWRRGNGHTEARSSEWWADRIDAGAGPDELAARSDTAAVVYASVLSHLARSKPPQSCFLNRNARDFDQPDIVAELQRHGCTMIPSFDHGHRYLRSRIRKRRSIR